MRSWFTDPIRGERQEEKAAFAGMEEDWGTGIRARRLGLGLLALGVLCRLYVYLLSFPIWRDEAALALNFAARDFRGLLHELDNYQVAPLFFLWIEKAVYSCLGGTAEALRLAPLLAGVAGLVLFWRLARLCLTPLPAALAVGCLAVSSSSIHLASMVKPYSLDLLLATLLLTLAVGCLRAPNRSGPLAALALVVPFAVPASYPVIFVAGGVSLVLLPVVWRKGRWAGRCWYIVFNVLCVAVFAAHLRFVGRPNPALQVDAVKPYMDSFWKEAFLPAEPLSALYWLLRCHVGHLFSYPVEWNGGGLVGLVLCLAGASALWRRRQFGLLGLCLAPLALNFVAGALHRYPYAGDQRLEQHLVPGLCLLLGMGAADLIQRLASGAVWRRRWAAAVAGLLVLIGFAGILGDTLRPYHDVEACWARDIAGYLRREVRPQDQIVFRQPGRATVDCLRWQLLSLAGQIRSASRIDWTCGEQSEGRLWLVDQEHVPDVSRAEPPGHELQGTLQMLEQMGWQVNKGPRFQACGPGPLEQRVFRYCCDLHVLRRANPLGRRRKAVVTSRSSLRKEISDGPGRPDNLPRGGV